MLSQLLFQLSYTLTHNTFASFKGSFNAPSDRNTSYSDAIGLVLLGIVKGPLNLRFVNIFAACENCETYDFNQSYGIYAFTLKWHTAKLSIHTPGVMAVLYQR